MKAKLIKRGSDNYRLYVGEVAYATTGESPLKKLSLKNCQTIERGYDLDDLADEVLKKHNWETFPSAIKVFKEGFQKALEILGDKKFSEEDVISLIKKSREKKPYNFDGKSTEYKFSEDKLIQSLQQTEWDVEVEMECLQCQEWGYISECRNNCNKKFLQPKLDKDGCLILKLV